ATKKNFISTQETLASRYSQPSLRGLELVPLVASNRIGKETIETEHGNSTITFYGNSFIAGSEPTRCFLEC
ncbi:hypothetical protein B296_00045037, partial [Ensete ventricosum]